MWTSASRQRQRLQLVRRSGLKVLLKVSEHIRVSAREGGFARLIRIRRKQVSGVTVMRQEDWRHFIVRRLMTAVFRPHRSEASTRDSLMTDHLPEMGPNGPLVPPPCPRIESEASSWAPCNRCRSGDGTQTAGRCMLAIFNFPSFQGRIKGEKREIVYNTVASRHHRGQPQSAHIITITTYGGYLLKDHAFQAT